MWLILAATCPWHRDRVGVVGVLVLVVGASSYVVGGWVRGLYGLDPPYALYFLGTAMQMLALASPLVAGVYAARAVNARRHGANRRSSTDVA